IEEYKKLKQSVITEAVTKGIRPNREMKDSGIEWIGEIPKEWNVSFIKRYCSLKTGTTPSTTNSEWFDGELNWFTPGDFKDNYFLSNSLRKLSFKAKEDGVAVIVPSNTVLIIGIGGTAGKIGLTQCECSCNQQITALITTKMHSKYLMYWMIANTIYIKDTALYTTLPILNNETIGEYCLILPIDISEQQEIADYLDKKCYEIDNLIAKKEQIVTELESYKKSLIYEYVTGKKEV
ncbi:MAG: restriction endonuclease subunit S, partial [Oscillospiraceae bacterium]